MDTTRQAHGGRSGTGAAFRGQRDGNNMAGAQWRTRQYEKKAELRMRQDGYNVAGAI